jgi:hypothetical protein
MLLQINRIYNPPKHSLLKKQLIVTGNTLTSEWFQNDMLLLEFILSLLSKNTQSHGNWTCSCPPVGEEVVACKQTGPMKQAILIQEPICISYLPLYANKMSSIRNR